MGSEGGGWIMDPEFPCIFKSGCLQNVSAFQNEMFGCFMRLRPSFINSKLHIQTWKMMDESANAWQI